MSIDRIDPSFWARLSAAFATPVPYVACVLVTGLMGYSGPFGTYVTYGFAGRLAYWAPVVTLSVVIGIFVRVTVQHLWPRATTVGAGAATSAILSVVLVWPITLYSHVVSGVEEWTLAELLHLSTLIFFVGLGVTIMRHLIHGESSVPETQPDDEGPRLFARLASDLHAPMVRIEGSDHHVEITTRAGRAKVLMRFGDALTEIEGTNGVRCHRSHWIALDAVQGHEIRGGKMVLFLSDGAEVPVSRTYCDAVRRALNL